MHLSALLNLNIVLFNKDVPGKLVNCKATDIPWDQILEMHSLAKYQSGGVVFIASK